MSKPLHARRRLAGVDALYRVSAVEPMWGRCVGTLTRGVLELAEDEDEDDADDESRFLFREGDADEEDMMDGWDRLSRRSLAVWENKMIPTLVRA